MLILAGLGLNDEKDLTLREIEEAKDSDQVFIELYTSFWDGNLEKLEKILGKKIEVLSRKDLEEESKKILDLASKKKIVIFIQGDPLVATTHSSLILEAKKRKIETKILHNSSIISAITETGLHVYKFGPTVTIPLREKMKGVLPESVYQTIKDNKNRGLHTLCLLDIDFESRKYLSASEAVRILLEMEDRFGQGAISLESEVLVASKLGSNSPKIAILNVVRALKESFPDLPSVLILPGNLHFSEREYINLFRKL